MGMIPPIASLATPPDHAPPPPWLSHATPVVESYPTGCITKPPISIHHNDGIETSRLPLRNLVHSNDTTPEFLVRRHTIRDPRLHPQSERSDLVLWNGPRGHDVRPRAAFNTDDQARNVTRYATHLGSSVASSLLYTLTTPASATSGC